MNNSCQDTECVKRTKRKPNAFAPLQCLSEVFANTCVLCVPSKSVFFHSILSIRRCVPLFIIIKFVYFMCPDAVNFFSSVWPFVRKAILDGDKNFTKCLQMVPFGQSEWTIYLLFDTFDRRKCIWRQEIWRTKRMENGVRNRSVSSQLSRIDL